MKYFPILASGNIFKMMQDNEYQWKPSVRECIMDWPCKAWVEVLTNILELRAGNLGLEVNIKCNTLDLMTMSTTLKILNHATYRRHRVRVRTEDSLDASSVLPKFSHTTIVLSNIPPVL
jgi:hypothetical protein